MSDHMPRKDAELPPRMPEAAIIAELRAELAQVKAAAAAAVALVVERAAEGADFAKNRLEAIADEGWNGDARDFKRSIPGVFSELDAIRALAHVDGLAEVQALRAERDGLTQNAEATNGIWQANLRLIAERDTLAALILVLPFARLPGLAGLTPLGVWVGLAVYLLPLWLWVYADELSDGNCGGDDM